MCTLKLEAKGQRIWIHNIYSQPPGSVSTINYSTPIPKLLELLQKEGEHIVLGDFNLHYLLWCRIRNLAAHQAADQLIEILHLFELSLTLSHAKVTREGPRGEESTIDLVFTTPTLQNRIIECQVHNDLDQGSDYFPISTEIALEAQVKPERPQRY